MPADRLTPAQVALAKTRARPRKPSAAQIDAEREHCKADEAYFINTYCKIYDNDRRTWIPFTLWPIQLAALDLVRVENRIVGLKARQEGFTWLWAIADSLWDMLFNPIAEILMFSQREDEALHLLSDQRLRGMITQLPKWMQPLIIEDNKSEIRFENGSGARALPGSAGGDSRTVTKVVIDEADLVDDLDSLLTRAEPTVGKQGKIVLLSRADKSKPNSTFKRLYNAAKTGESEYKPFFASWRDHPGRDQAWYDAKCRDAMKVKGSLDSVHEQYPATDIEALQARTLDKRFPPQWLAAVFQERRPLPLRTDTPVIPGLKLFAYPVPGRHYGAGADPAGGGSDGDDAVCHIVDAESGAQVAVFGGKIEPTQFANYVADLALYFNSAPILYELNNHGHAVQAQLKFRGASLRSGMARDGSPSKPGWLTTERSKNMLYDTGVKVIQQLVLEAEQEERTPDPIIFDYETMTQIASIDVSTLSAPEGQHDDYSMSWVLGQQCVYRGASSMSQERVVGLYPKRDEEMIPPRRSAAPVRSVVKADTGADESRRQEWERGEKESMEDWTGRIRYKTSERFKN